MKKRNGAQFRGTAMLADYRTSHQASGLETLQYLGKISTNTNKNKDKNTVGV